jgi:ribosomal protein L11 methyltransferase
MDVPPEAKTIIRLDPGLAFGSGTHPTTALCLEWIDAQSFKGLSVMDFGCGSGVLGVAAALKGAAEVSCIDNDPQAIVATGENATRNGVGSQLTTHQAARPEIETTDIILANILAGTLIELASELCSALRPDGLLALSGILEEQADEVASVYSQWLDDIELKAQDNWVLITGRRRRTV